MNVYCLYFPNGKRYVGVENRPMNRINGHARMATLGQKHPQVVHLAIAKHGWENVRWRYLATNCDKDTAWKLEIFFIKLFQTQDRKWGYNVSAGGRAGMMGVTLSAQARQRVSAAQKAIDGPTRFKAGQSPWNKGRAWAEETRQKVSESRMGTPAWNRGKPCTWSWNKGVPCPPETRAKISATKLARVPTGAAQVIATEP